VVHTYNLFGNASIAAGSVTNASAILAGLTFNVTGNGLYLAGYRYFIADGNQPSGPQSFALWQVFGSNASLSNFALVSGSHLTSGSLVPGWNNVMFPSALPLSASVEYQVATGFTGNFIDVQNQFGAGQPFSAGIVSGPVTAYSDSTGTAGDNFSNPQGWFGTTGADPTASPAYEGFNSSNFGIDLIVTDGIPSGGSLRLWPSQPHPVNWANDTANNFTLGTEFVLSRACALNKIWFFSPTGTTQLPTETGIWNTGTQSLVSGTHQASPSWSGAAGSGWVSVSYSGVTLPAGDYKTSVFNGAATPVVWSATTVGYWQGPTGPGQNGITNSVLSAPNNATATAPGQSTYHPGATFAWPDTYAPAANSAVYWVDVEVTPV
jgi:hypothetical protein